MRKKQKESSSEASSQSQWEREKEIRREAARRRKVQQRLEKKVLQEEVDLRTQALENRSKQKQQYISYVKKNLRGQVQPAAQTRAVPVSVIVAPKPRNGAAAKGAPKRDSQRTKQPFLGVGGQGGIGYEMEMSPSDMNKSTVQHRMQALSKLGEQKVDRSLEKATSPFID
jgi:hypothetical protein